MAPDVVGLVVLSMSVRHRTCPCSSSHMAMCDDEGQVKPGLSQLVCQWRLLICQFLLIAEKHFCLSHKFAQRGPCQISYLTVNHTVYMRPLWTGSLQSLHSAEDDAFNRLETTTTTALTKWMNVTNLSNCNTLQIPSILNKMPLCVTHLPCLNADLSGINELSHPKQLGLTSSMS